MSVTDVAITPPWNEDTKTAGVEIAPDGALQNKPSLLDGLIGYWKMNEQSWNGTPDEVIDYSPNLNHGVAVGTPPTTAPGFNGAMRGDFDGTIDYVRVPTINGISGTEGTILFWYNFDTTPNRFMWVYQLTPFTTSHVTTGIIISLDLRTTERNYRVVSIVDAVIKWDWHSADGLLTPLSGSNNSFEVSHNGISPVFYHNRVDITAAGIFVVGTDKTVWADDWLAAAIPITDLILAGVITASTLLEPLDGKEWGAIQLDRVLTAGERTALDNSGAGGFIETIGPFSTSAESCERNPIIMDEPFNSDEITVQLDRTPLAPTEIKVYVNEGSGFGPAHNVNITPTAETGNFDFEDGTTYNEHTNVILKIEINSPNSQTQLRVLSVKIKGITVISVAEAAIFNLPLELIELPELEVIEL